MRRLQDEPRRSPDRGASADQGTAGRAGRRSRGWCRRSSTRGGSVCGPSCARRSRRSATRWGSPGHERRGRRHVRGRAAGVHRSVPAAGGADPRAEGRRLRRAGRDGDRRVPRLREGRRTLGPGGGHVVPRDVRGAAGAEGRPADASAHRDRRGRPARSFSRPRVRALEGAGGFPEGGRRARPAAGRRSGVLHERRRPRSGVLAPLPGPDDEGGRGRAGPTRRAAAPAAAHARPHAT